MATNAQWTVVFEDKLVIKQNGDAAGTGYNIVDHDTAAPLHSKKPVGIDAADHGTIVAVGIPSIPVRLSLIHI